MMACLWLAAVPLLVGDPTVAVFGLASVTATASGSTVKLVFRDDAQPIQLVELVLRIPAERPPETRGGPPDDIPPRQGLRGKTGPLMPMPPEMMGPYRRDVPEHTAEGWMISEDAPGQRMFGFFGAANAPIQDIKIVDACRHGRRCAVVVDLKMRRLSTHLVSGEARIKIADESAQTEIILHFNQPVVQALTPPTSRPAEKE